MPRYEARPSQTSLEAPELLELQKLLFRVRAGIIFEWFGWFLMFFEWLWMSPALPGAGARRAHRAWAPDVLDHALVNSHHVWFIEPRLELFGVLWDGLLGCQGSLISDLLTQLISNL